MSIIEKVKKTIIENELIKKGESVLVALSGGSDSVFMLNILFLLSKEMDFKLYAAHVNHQIREEADADENFVLDLCSELGICCFSKTIDVLAVAKENSVSTELAGREARYEFFKQIMKENQIDKLATAHNKNDSAESILLHLTRGCGIDGMCGIPVKRDGYIIRPIIDINKHEIEEFCKEHDLKYVVDKTNFETQYTRNKVRLNLIPAIENDINTNFINTVTENAKIFKETKSFIDNYTKKVYENILKDCKLDCLKLLKEDDIIIKNVILLHFKNYTDSCENLSITHINEIVMLLRNSISPKSVNLPAGITAKIEYGKLYFEKTSNESVLFEYDISLDKELYIPECDEYITIKEETKIKKNTKDKIYFYVDGSEKFKVRNRRNGDKFMPVGMRGTKKLSDYFTDLKIPVSKRDLTLILTYDDEIVWVVGKRVDRRFSKGKKLMSATITGRSK